MRKNSWILFEEISDVRVFSKFQS